VAKKSSKQKRKLCPVGVPSDCLYCVELKKKVWRVLDPKGATIDESKSQVEATDIAEGYIAQCEASKSGYGKRPVQKRISAGGGPFKW
jgi:hypothetical protein